MKTNVKAYDTGIDQCEMRKGKTKANPVTFPFEFHKRWQYQCILNGIEKLNYLFRNILGKIDKGLT